MNRKNKRNRRRGIAIELAITVLMIVFALSTILVSTAMIQAGNYKRSDSTFEQQIALDQIGEGFCAAVKNGANLTEWAQSVEGYTVTATRDAVSAALEVKNESEILLRVVLQTDAEKNTYRVTHWGAGEAKGESDV